MRDSCRVPSHLRWVRNLWSVNNDYKLFYLFSFKESFLWYKPTTLVFELESKQKTFVTKKYGVKPEWQPKINVWDQFSERVSHDAAVVKTHKTDPIFLPFILFWNL